MAEPTKCPAGMKLARGGRVTHSGSGVKVDKRVDNFCVDKNPPANAQYDRMIKKKYDEYVDERKKENLRLAREGRKLLTIDDFRSWSYQRYRGDFPSDPIVSNGRVQHAYRYTAREYCWSKGKRLPTLEETLFLLKVRKTLLPYISTPMKAGAVFTWFTDSLEKTKYRAGLTGGESPSITVTSIGEDHPTIGASFFCVTSPTPEDAEDDDSEGDSGFGVE